VTVPVGLSLLLYEIDPVIIQKMAMHVVVTTFFSAIALTPAALLLVTESNFAWKLIGSIGFAILILIAFLLVDSQLSPEHTVMTHAATCVVVFLNLLVLRGLGLRWMPFEGKPQ